MAIYNRCLTCLFYSVFLISSFTHSASNLYDWTFSGSNSEQFHISGSTIYNNANYNRSTTLNLNDSNQKALFMSTIKNRLFQTDSGFNTTSVDQLKSDLINEGWKVDQNTRTIYKDVYPNRTCSFFNANGELVDFTANGIAKFQCPKDAADALSKANAAQYNPKRSYTWNGWDSEAINYSDNPILARYMFTENKNKYYEVFALERYSVHDEQVLPKRVFMTESQLFDFIRSKDNVVYSNVYRAYTNYEKLNNKSYLYITDLFMPFEPTNTDIELPNNNNNPSNNPNPTNPNNPNPSNPNNGEQTTFCSYATVICDFIDWFKKDPDSASDENVTIKDHGTESYNHYWTEYFNVSPMCPRPHIMDFTIDLKVTQQRFYYEFEYTQMCSYAQQLRPFFLFAAYVACAMIVAGVRNG